MFDRSRAVFARWRRVGWALALAAACAAPPPSTDSAVGPASDSGAPPPPALAAADQAGPYAVGATTLTVDDPRGGSLVVEVWYPALDPGTGPDPYPEIAIVGQAFRDAVPDPRARALPVVAFSHGFGGVRYQSASLTEHLASHGMVVVAPDHRHHTLFDLDPSQTGVALVERPGELARAVDALEGWPPSATLADPSAVVVVGHSFGALTALIAGGGALDLEAGQAWCDATPTAGCAFFDDTALGDPATAQPDPRAVGAALLAPGGWYAFGDHGLAGLVPSLGIAGTADADLPYDTEGWPTLERLPAPSTRATLIDAGHWGFTDLCALIPGLADCAGAAGGFMEPARVRQATRTLVTAFAQHRLRGPDDRWTPWLDPAAWPDPDVTLEPTPEVAARLAARRVARPPRAD